VREEAEEGGEEVGEVASTRQADEGQRPSGRQRKAREARFDPSVHDLPANFGLLCMYVNLDQGTVRDASAALRGL
jgi:hypothetical protein